MTQTVIGYFNTPDNAYSFEESLRRQGIDEASCHIAVSDGGQQGQSMEEIRNFLSEVFGPGNPQEIQHYTDEISQGGALLSVDLADDEETKPIRDAMLHAGAADTSILRPMEEENQSIPVYEEEMEVGKRQTAKGSVEVSSRLEETPVQEDVNLKEERASIKRRQVDRPVSPEEIEAMGDRTIEVEETAEKPVVSKSARVVEEVEVGKETSERIETVEDTLRHTEIDVKKGPGKGSKGKSGK